MDLSNYTPEPNSGCWLWLGAVSSNGYGAVVNSGRTISAHRASYEAEFGPIPPGLFVCHRCDVKSCINPDHLFAGTPKQNTQDMIAKGRKASMLNIRRLAGDEWRAAHKGTLQTGGSHHAAKLTEADVIAIRGSSERGVDLAKKYNVSTNSISRIRLGRVWKSVGG